MLVYCKSSHYIQLQWNFNRNSFIFIQENRFENVIWKMAAILSRPQCVNNWVDMSASINVAIWLFWHIWPLDGISVALYYIDTLIESIASLTGGFHNSSEVQLQVYIMYAEGWIRFGQLSLYIGCYIIMWCSRWAARSAQKAWVHQPEGCVCVWHRIGYPHEDIVILLIELGWISEPVWFLPGFSSVDMVALGGRWI